MIDEIKSSADFLKEKGIEDPEIAIILGTGLGKLTEKISIKVELLYDEIPGFVASTMEYHDGRLIYGSLQGKKVIAMQGRYHYYEGYNMQQITFPVRVMKLLGVKKLLVSNAAGAINLNFRKGDLMVIDDHIDLLPENPLTGKNIDELGPRFPDMSQPYSANINNMLFSIAEKLQIPLHKGVYVSVKGPNLETRAEYRYLKIIGADAVGMSTVPEIITANHMGLECAAISVLTDECDPDNLQPINVPEIIKIAGEAEKKLTRLIEELLKLL